MAAPRDSNPDMLIQRLPDLLAAEFLGVHGLPKDLLCVSSSTKARLPCRNGSSEETNVPLYSGKAIHANRVERIQTILVSKGLSLYQISQQWQSEAQTFIRKEEERPVLQDRPAKGASKIILLFSWL